MKKVNIQYIWVEEYKCLKNVEFNFSTKYHIHYNQEENALECSMDENYIDDFFGKDIDVTAVVGGNGAGKTTFLEMAAAAYQGKLSCDFIVAFAIVEEIERVHFFYNLNQVENIPKCVGNKSIFITLSEVSMLNDREAERKHEEYSLMLEKCSSIPSIHMSNVLDASKYGKYRNFTYDISTTGLIGDKRFLSYSTSSFNLSHPLDILDFYKAELQLQLDFIGKYKNAGKVMFGFPMKLSIIPCELDSQNPHDEIQQNNVKLLLHIIEERHEHYEQHDVAYGAFLSFLNNIVSFINHENNRDELSTEFKNMLGEAPLKLKNCHDVKKEILSILHDLKSTKYGNVASTYAKFIEKFYEELDDGRWLMRSDPADGYRWNLCEDSIEKLQKLLSLYFDTVGNYPSYPYLNFSWGLSSGEMAMFSLFARFYSLKKAVRGRKWNIISYIKAREAKWHAKLLGKSYRTHILLFIDEADMLFHPEWQQKYMKSLLDFLPKIFPGAHLQIIIATHSPIMLSDIPKQNVIYLKKDDEKGTVVIPNADREETFGANIFRLFNDAFFLEEGAIGELASEKIRDLLQMIHSYSNETNTQEIQKCISAVGDPFLRNNIQKEFEKKLNNKSHRIEALKQRVEYLKEEIRRLELTEQEEQE